MSNPLTRPRIRKTTPDVDPVFQSLRRARMAAGLTQEQLASQIGISREMISHYERGKAEPTMRTLRRWAKAVGHVMALIQVQKFE